MILNQPSFSKDSQTGAEAQTSPNSSKDGAKSKQSRWTASYLEVRNAVW